MIFDFNCSNFDGFLDFVVYENTIESDEKQVPDLCLIHFADEYLVKITHESTNTITLIYESIRWNLDFILDSHIKIRCNKKVPETNKILYSIDDLQQVWAITD